MESTSNCGCKCGDFFDMGRLKIAENLGTQKAGKNADNRVTHKIIACYLRYKFGAI
ncbi:hypothetical protein SAMN05444266_10493 [Chitinophaga jiangningensis]|uniref:Uncharacterized protein n=1 Tax=Chitinophaga jiangningensis TaxID=1419482 RepID=A0A1M7BVM4_9BACT|nr:hypothetical protein [Chitinophaga jiangningensis]SHL59041.1 hypothetical protein SAMN05444266_10493 [Chitinophaga jiangningensis]